MDTYWKAPIFTIFVICFVLALSSNGLPVPIKKNSIYGGDDRPIVRFRDDAGGLFLHRNIPRDPLAILLSGTDHAQKLKLLSRKIRSTENGANDSGDSDGIVGFFEDNNNKAMYLVLPLLVLVYGGCSAIYCVAKCRRYIRKCHRQKKQKQMQQERQKKVQQQQLLQPGQGGPDDGGGSRGNPDGKERGSTADDNDIALHKNGLDSRPASENSDSQSIPGQIVDYDDQTPLVAATARKHTPAPAEHNEKMQSLDKTVAAKPTGRRHSRDIRTPSSVRAENSTYSRQPDPNDEATMASKAALFFVSNSHSGGNRSNPEVHGRDYSTPSTSSAGMSHHHDAKAGFKAMLESNYNPKYVHNADPWETMKAMEMKRLGQSSGANVAPWSNQILYDEFGRPKPQKKQRLIFVA